jgi:uroporphyrinogen decarboxylase
MPTRLAPLEPDLDGFMKTMRREGTPDRVHYFEHGIAEPVQRAIAERHGVWDGIGGGGPRAAWDRAAALHRFLGHEFFRVFPPNARLEAPKVDGRWTNASTGVVRTWDDVERLDWPGPEAADLSVLEHYEYALPESMRVFHVVDVWEVVRDTMGFENVCVALCEQPDLVEALLARVGAFVEAVTRACCDFRCYGGVYLGDDLGHKTGLMIGPEAVRAHILPWHRRIAAIVHEHGKLFLFHSCGRMYDLMDDYIDDAGIDAKHSFEDAILPVTEAKRRYGARVSLLGGIDVDLLARGDEAAIRAKVRATLDVCQPGGGYFLGSGNWVTEYVGPENYLVMLDEARRWRAGSG